MFTTPTPRDHIAAGYLAAHAGDETNLPKKADVATYSYELADALLAQRDRAKPPPATPEAATPAAA